MKKQMQKIFTAAIGIVLTVSLLSLPARADQPFMRAAKENLNDAKSSLKKATADKGGHRERAKNLISQATAEVNRGIEFDRNTNNDRGRRRGSSDFEENTIIATSTDQPNMQAAKNHLQNALNNLQRASADKGGHRERAMDLVRSAIDEVNKGIAFDRSN